jgi:hypothetical protein
MAMPSSIPPPPEAEQERGLGALLRVVSNEPEEPVTGVRVVRPDPDLVEEVLALAKKMGDSVGDQIGDVLNRTKSRNWMVGRLRRSGLWTDDAIRDAIDHERKNHRRTISDELCARPVQLSSRRPLKFLEANTWPVWGPRVEQLGALVVYPMTVLELTRRAAQRMGWEDENWVKQTVAAAEYANELWYDRAFQHWHRTERRIILANPKKKTMTERVSRHLPVALDDKDRAELVNRLRAIDDETAALEAEFEEFKTAQRAKLRQREDARERVLNAMKTGREVQLVECESRFDYAARQVTTVRKDTGEVVESREMTTEELQTIIPEVAASS